MSRTDHQLRRPKTEAHLYSAKLRAGLKVPGLRNVAPLEECWDCGGNNPFHLVSPCRTCGQASGGKARPKTCHPLIKSEVDILRVLKMKAFCGDLAAREVVPCDCGKAALKGHADGCGHAQRSDLKAWIVALLKLANALPDVVVDGVACPEQGPGVLTCPRCNGTGIINTETKAPRYISACIGLAVGRAAYFQLEDNRNECANCQHERSGCQYHDSIPWVEIEDTLDACERWTWCPCPDNAEAWNLAWTSLPPSLGLSEPWAFMWVPSFNLLNLIDDTNYASEIIDSTRIRKAAKKMVLSCI